MDEFHVKEEILETSSVLERKLKRNDNVSTQPVSVIELSSSSSSSSESDSDDDDDDDDDDDSANEREAKRARVSSDGDDDSTKEKKKKKKKKKRRSVENLGVVLPAGFLAPLPPEERVPVAVAVAPERPPLLESASLSAIGQSCKQFWKAGDYEGAPCGEWDLSSGIVYCLFGH